MPREKTAGKKLENSIQKANFYYRKKELACIQYLPVPVRITRRGTFLIQSTVDFVGVVGPDGRAIAFDAKHTASKTSFPLSNIHDHQIEYLRSFHKSGGRAYFLIQFSNIHGEENVFVTPLDFVLSFWDKTKIGGRKSIPLGDFDANWLKSLDNYLKL